jgi:hypothetical protein
MLCGPRNSQPIAIAAAMPISRRRPGVWLCAHYCRQRVALRFAQPMLNPRSSDA